MGGRGVFVLKRVCLLFLSHPVIIMSKDSKKDNGDLPTGNFSSNEKTQSNIKAFIDLVPADEQIIQNYIRSLKQKLISLKSASKRHSTAAKSHHHASSSRPAINHSGQPCQQDSILNCLRNNLKARKSVCQ